MSEKIGFMGMGIMGAAMAGNILKAGYSVTVYNRSLEKTEPLASMGAAVARSPHELARTSDIVIAMVTGPEALDNLLWGPDGACSEFDGGKVFINMSSVTPQYNRHLARKLASTGVVFIDAPVSGTKKPAEEGTLVILAGGPQDRVQALDPLFLAMGKKVIYLRADRSGTP